MYLNCHSFHSLRYGTIPLSELVSLAVANNVKALALTDINTVTGIYDFTKECLEKGIKPLVGIDFRNNSGKLLYIGLATNQAGISEMCRFVTKHNFDDTPKPNHAPDFKNVIVIYPQDNVPSILKDYEYIGIRPEQLTSLVQKGWKDKIDRMVALSPVTFNRKKNSTFIKYCGL